MKKGVILCEGADEKHVIFHMIKKVLFPSLQHLTDILKCPDIEGCYDLIGRFPVFIKESEYLPLGVIIDANTSFDNRWKSIRNILKKAEYSDIPTKLLPIGTIITDKSRLLPDIGIWIMPDNKSKGMLEDFIKLLIPEDDDLKKMA